MSSRPYRPESLRKELVDWQLFGAVRIIPSELAKTPTDAGFGSTRFGAPDREFRVLYAAASFEGAFGEAVVREKFVGKAKRHLPAAEIDERHVVELGSSRSLRLLDLQGAAPTRLGAPTAVVGDSRHASGQRLSLDLYRGVPEADGVLYLSRFTGVLCVAVFDRAFEYLEAETVRPLWNRVELADVLEDYGITVTSLDD